MTDPLPPTLPPFELVADSYTAHADEVNAYRRRINELEAAIKASQRAMFDLIEGRPPKEAFELTLCRVASAIGSAAHLLHDDQGDKA